MKPHWLSLFILLLLSACGDPTPVSQPDRPEKPKVKMAGILPLGDIPDKDVHLAMDSLGAYYAFDLVLMPRAELPEMAWYPPRARYRADSILKFLNASIPDSLDRIVALTNKDISTTKGGFADWGIMGLARLPGRVCVVSSFRTRRGTKGRAHFEERFARVVKHEFGHTLGLPHCPSPKCFMRDANGRVSTVDEEGGTLCGDCSRKVAPALRVY